VAGTAAFVICLNRGESEGRVVIRSSDPTEHPHIDHRYLSAERDFERFEHGWEFFRELIQRPVFRRHGVREMTDGQSPREIVARHVGTAQHPVGTCRMGPPEDSRTVVDHRLRVHGIEGLMVADSSIFPDNTMNNTNLTCYVIGEVAADLIEGRRG
jgi:choline dehydrogenase